MGGGGGSTGVDERLAKSCLNLYEQIGDKY